MKCSWILRLLAPIVRYTVEISDVQSPHESVFRKEIYRQVFKRSGEHTIFAAPNESQL